MMMMMARVRMDVKIMDDVPSSDPLHAPLFLPAVKSHDEGRGSASFFLQHLPPPPPPPLPEPSAISLSLLIPPPPFSTPPPHLRRNGVLVI